MRLRKYSKEISAAHLGVGRTVLLAALASSMPAPSAAQPSEIQQHRGETIVASRCARCHAVGRQGRSPDARAPTFATLARRISPEDLRTMLERGALVGHPEMPNVALGERDVDAVVEYFRTLGEP
jgi:cytochrome c